MSDIRKISREFLSEFLSIYRSHPALWKVKSKEYVNKHLKNKGYDELVEHYKTLYPNADRDLVAKKIQSMRGSFRKELKKYEAWKRSGEDYDYVPSLWYFDLLMFTKDQELPADGLDSVVYSPSSDVDDSNDDAGHEETIHEEQRSEVSSCGGDKSVAGNEAEFKIYKKKFRKRPTSVVPVQSPGRENLIIECAPALKNDNRTDPESEAFGQLIAAKHAKLSPEQKLYAEMLIVNVLNKGILNRLTDNTNLSE